MRGTVVQGQRSTRSQVRCCCAVRWVPGAKERGSNGGDGTSPNRILLNPPLVCV